ncbi:MAG: DDE-type integrase/transposase/recombinase [Planctomycetaceae bacterium]|nr:DDE-type integrase/transposase/recombinase [Planctomycetaceae bacterium]
MEKIVHPLLAMIASATDRELAKYVEFLKEENRILRARVPGKQVHTKPHERERLLKLGRSLGRAVEELITIVSPSTFYRWLREQKEGPKRKKNSKGGQRKPKEIRELVLQIATLTGFGYTRILGELRKLGIRKISRQTVRNILKEEGIEPGPDRTSDCWENFIARHAKTLWAVDFFSVRTVTSRGFQEMYVLVWLCMTSREIIVSESTQHPNSAWVVQQSESFLEQTLNRDDKPAIVMHDRDTKFTKEFVSKLKQHGVRNNVLPKAAPNLNGRCERAIFTLKEECLRKFIIFGKQHLDYLLSEFADYYNTARSSMVRDHLPPVRSADPEEVATLTLDQVETRTYVGGLVTAFARRAA